MTDNKTVVELLEPVDRDYKAWRKFVEDEKLWEDEPDDYTGNMHCDTY